MIFWPLYGFIGRTDRYDRKDDEREWECRTVKDPRLGLSPGAAAARTSFQYINFTKRIKNIHLQCHTHLFHIFKRRHLLTVPPQISAD